MAACGHHVRSPLDMISPRWSRGEETLVMEFQQRAAADVDVPIDVTVDERLQRAIAVNWTTALAAVGHPTGK